MSNRNHGLLTIIVYECIYVLTVAVNIGVTREIIVIVYILLLGILYIIYIHVLLEEEKI